MPEVWPVDVNQDVLREPYSEMPEDSVYRFKPDVGASIDISRTITAGTIVSFQQWFTLAEFDTISDWRRFTLKNATLSFSRNYPLSGVVGEFKFMKDGFKLVRLLPAFRIVAFELYRIA